jgi:hypothetical protein
VQSLCEGSARAEFNGEGVGKVPNRAGTFSSGMTPLDRSQVRALSLPDRKWPSGQRIMTGSILRCAGVSGSMANAVGSVRALKPFIRAVFLRWSVPSSWRAVRAVVGDSCGYPLVGKLEVE